MNFRSKNRNSSPKSKQRRNTLGSGQQLLVTEGIHRIDGSGVAAGRDDVELRGITIDNKNRITYSLKVGRNFRDEAGRRMATIDQRAAAKIQTELMSGESVYWAGMPNPGVVFHSDDWQMVPFSLLWGGFTIFWEAGALGYWGNGARGGGPSLFMTLWGIPFVAAGQYLIWGRFVVDAWLKRRTYYAATNRRALILQDGWKRKTSSIFLEEIPTISFEGTMTGTLWFGPKYPIIVGRGSRKKTRSLSRFDVGDVPVFADIDDVESVYRLILNLREKLGKKSNSAAGDVLTYPDED
jgi:hypothetical protein